MSRILSALAIALSLVSEAIADDPPLASLDFGVFDPMPQLVSNPYTLGDKLDFDVFGVGKTVAVQEPLDFSVFEPMDKNTSVSIKPAVKIVPTPTKSGGYPLRDASTWWTGCPRDRMGAIAHLSGGKHAGAFDSAWLATLSVEELHSLHSDHEEGCVDETKIKRAPLPAINQKPVVPAPPVATYQQAAPQCRWVWNGFRYVQSCR